MNDTNSETGMQAGKQRMEGSDLVDMFTAGAIALRRNVEAINALNVFPVPDGDTGTNMYLTMQNAIEEIVGLKGESTAEDVTSKLYDGAFMGARGNSGIILSQFLKGFADGLEGNANCGVDDVARACDLARENAYKSVTDPVEGTMLTVITSIAEAARDAADDGQDIQAALRIVSHRAQETVTRTTEMLPVLQEAGVVDAGGQGLAVVVEGFRRNVAGEDPDEDTYDIQTPEGSSGAAARISDEFLSAHEHDAYGYCTQFVLEADELDLDDLRTRMNGIADSTVVIGNSSRAMVHGHAEDPGKLISAGVLLGSIGKVKIENMDAQRDQLSATLMREADAGPAVIAVVPGVGIAEAFHEAGAAQVVPGGNTMNPSVRDLMTAIDRTRGDTVYLLPNNKNIVPTAKQAAEQSSKDVRVVETVSIPQGIAASIHIMDNAEVEDVLRSVESEIGEVKSGEITRAVRDASMDSVEVREGQYIGLLDGKLLATGDTLQETLTDLIDKADVTGDNEIRLYYGSRVSKSDADDCAAAVQKVYDAPEKPDVVYGGQPHYEFIISIE